VSIKKTFSQDPQGFKYFLIISLCLHGVLLWSILYLSHEGGWLARKRVQVKKPEYVQVVELPPNYKFPGSSLAPPKKPKRYADKTSVVEKENIPGGKAILIRPISGAIAGKKSMASRGTKARKATKTGKAAKKTAGIAKPRRIFKTKKGAATGKGIKKAQIDPQKKAIAASAKAEPRKNEKLEDRAALPLTEGDILLPNKKKKSTRIKHKTSKTTKKRSLSASKGKGHEKGGGGNTLNPDAGHNKAAANAPASRFRPNLLLSDNKVSELARRYQGSGPHTKSKTLMLNTSELKYQKYLIELRHKIEQYWEYPRSAAMRGWEGKLFIDFTIKRDGTITDVRLSRSSRYPILDDAAITALKLSSPFTTFPKNFKIDELRIHGQFVYNLINFSNN